MNLEIDIDDLVNELNLPQDVESLLVHNAVQAVTVDVYRNWRLEAANALTSTRNDYINGLQIITNSLFSNTIQLNGKLNNMVENGVEGFDMKEGYQKSPKVKYTYKTDKNGNVTVGWYLTIPFRHGVPGTIGDNSAFSGIMPQEIHDIVSIKPAKQGIRRSELPSPYDIPQTRSKFHIPSKKVDIPAYTHKSSIYEGLAKQTAAYGKTTQNTYVSFRRVGSGSDPNSWWHTGIKAHKLLDKAIASTDVGTIAENAVDKTLADLGY